jgi:outer membrane receptor protein involved in Fe transport
VVNGFGINANGGTAVSKGGEFSFSVIPTAGLTLSLNGAYTDAYLTEDTDPILVGGVDGDPLPYVPDWTFGLMADYDWVVGGEWTMVEASRLHRRTGVRRDDRTDDGSLNAIDDYMTVNSRAACVSRWTFEPMAEPTDEMGIAVDASNEPLAAPMVCPSSGRGPSECRLA